MHPYNRFLTSAILPLLLLQVLLSTLTIAQGRASRDRSSNPSSVREVFPVPNVRSPRQLTDLPLPAGSYTVGGAGDFATLDSAFNRLSGGGILGPVTLLLIDTVYNAWATSTGSYDLVGPIVGAAFVLLLREGLSRFFTEYYLIPIGIIFIAMVIFMPQGLLGFARRRLNQ